MSYRIVLATDTVDCCDVQSEVDALRQLCVRAGVGQNDINTCSPVKSIQPFYLLTFYSSPVKFQPRKLV